MTYEILKDKNGDNACIKFTDLNGKEFWIPFDEGNSDYQAYLASLDEQQAAQQLGGNPIGLD